jgi:aspartyl-tRNA synthetase
LQLHQTSYRTDTCADLSEKDLGRAVTLAGWLHRKRDHGQLIFVDLRDHYGIVQCVFSPDSPCFATIDKLKSEAIIQLKGSIVSRPHDTVNPLIPTGSIEVVVSEITVLSESMALPFPVNQDLDCAEEVRLTHRFLDLRREKLHQNIILRSKVIASLRRRMLEQGFTEFQTPILTASSPEGARDFLVPSRLHPGQFYALPQAPQQFKQLLMVAGFDKYFQIAPCFRDEDARADRSPGEFYQLDIEMSFVSQDDVFNAIEPVLHGVFEEFAKDRLVSPYPFQRISFADAMLKYGSDKPDLRNPLIICDVSNIFENAAFTAFADIVKARGVVRAINVPGIASQPRSFFDKLNMLAQEAGMPGLGYVVKEGAAAQPAKAAVGAGTAEDQTQAEYWEAEKASTKGPIAKFLSGKELAELFQEMGTQPGDAVFFVADKNPAKAAKNAGFIRTKIADALNLVNQHRFELCWVTDFPMYERDELSGQIVFSHNPFSMPQGGWETLLTQHPLEIKAYQYDIVCNGIELSSGAIRNHEPETLYKAFEIAGYSRDMVDEKFGGMINAFRFGAPPHGGCAPGIDRIIMLLANEQNIREIIAFPFNQQAQDLMMKAPSEVTAQQLHELSIAIVPPKK